jgi:hypothetical protein
MHLHHLLYLLGIESEIESGVAIESFPTTVDRAGLATASLWITTESTTKTGHAAGEVGAWQRVASV